jgi:gliding motility-associated-like protein
MVSEKARHCLFAKYPARLSVVVLLLFSFSFAHAQTISSCSGTPFNYIMPSEPFGTTYTWTAPSVSPAGAITGGSQQSSPQSSVSQVLVNTTTSPAIATYDITTSTGNSFQLQVTVNPLPKLDKTTLPNPICSKQVFDYFAVSTTSPASFTWSRLAVPGIAQSGNQGNGNNPHEILRNTTTQPITVKYNYTVSANGCVTNNEEIEVVVNPTPNLTSPDVNNAAVCSGTPFNYTPTSDNGNTFTWTRPAVPGISNGTINGTGTINENLVNTTLLPIQVRYIYTIENTSLQCSSNNEIVYETVLPVPNVADDAPASCSGNTFKSSPINVPIGTTYTWATPTQLSGGLVTGGSAVSSPNFFIGQELNNISGADGTLRYLVTPSSYGCAGNTFFVDVTVSTTGNSKPILNNPTINAICSGGVVNHVPAYTTSGSSVNSYTWERFYVAGIAQGRGVGTGNIQNDRLDNTTTGQITAYYAYTVETANGCEHTQIVSVPVNPPTTLNTTLNPAAICSNTPFSYGPGSATPGTSFNWTRGFVAGISNPIAAGTDNPNETLINTTNAAIPVTYQYTLITPGGCTNTQNVTISVKPTPRLLTPLDPTAVCSGQPFSYTHQSSVAATAFNWTRAFMNGLSNGPGAGINNIYEMLINTTKDPIIVPYEYSLNANGCTNQQTVNATINPTPAMFSQSLVACSNVETNLNLSNIPLIPAATKFTWALPTITPTNSIGSGQTTGTNQDFRQKLVNQTVTAATAVYTVTPILGTCAGSAFTLSVTVNPAPSVSNQLLAPVCSGSAFTLSPTNVPSGTTYTWSSPVQSPFNSLTGAGAQPVNQPFISQTLSSSNNITDTAVYYVTPSAGNCTGNEFTVTVHVRPVPVINNMIDTICTGSAFLIAPSPVPVNTTYTWPIPVALPFGSVVGGTAQATPVSTLSQVLTNAITAPAQLAYTITPQAQGCTGAAFNLTVVVGNTLPAFANRVITICSGTSFDATPANAPQNTSYTWSVPTVMPAGTVVGLSAQSSPQQTISQTLTSFNDITDTVVYSIQPYKTGCLGNMFTATVRVLPSPRATITGNPVICRYPTDSLSVRFTGTGPWTFTYNDGITARTVSGVITSPYNWVVPVTQGLTTRTLAITGIRDFACNSIDTSFFVQRFNELPVGQVVSLHGQYICNNIPDTLFVSSPDSLGKQWTYNGRTITPPLTTDSIATLTGGSYNAILTNRFGCSDTAATPVTLYEVRRPVVQFVYDSYCINNLIRFTNRTDTAGIGATEWSWDFGDSTGAMVTYNSTHTYLRGGKHHVKLTAHQLFCPANVITADSTLDIQYPIAAVRLPSVSAYKRQSTPLAGREIAGYRYQWVPTKGIDDPFIHNPNFNYEVTQDYLIHLISPGGCITKDSMLVRVFDENLVNIMVPKSFTPNYDGVNDILYPYLSGVRTFNYFRVFNRFGKLMFETRNHDAGWNGSFNGIAQPMGIYVWVSTGIANDGSLVERRGEVLLLR